MSRNTDAFFQEPVDCIMTPEEEFEHWLLLNFEPPTDEELSELEKGVWK